MIPCSSLHEVAKASTYKVLLPLVSLLCLLQHLLGLLELGVHQLLLQVLVFEHFINVLQGEHTAVTSALPEHATSYTVCRELRILQPPDSAREGAHTGTTSSSWETELPVLVLLQPLACCMGEAASVPCASHSLFIQRSSNLMA